MLKLNGEAQSIDLEMCRIRYEGASLMSRHNWYQNKDWNDEIAATFFAKLKRARGKAQYLKLQAWHVAQRHPDIALQLIDEYFKTSDEYFQAQALEIRGHAYSAKNMHDDAVAAFAAAVARQISYPPGQSLAHLYLVVLVTDRKLELHYGTIERLFSTYQPNLVMANSRYMWHGSRALLLHERGNSDEAKQFAMLALEAARIEHSGFTRHPTVGLVSTVQNEFGMRILKIAGVLN